MGRMHYEVNLVAQKGSPMGHLARLENAGVRDRTPEGCHHQRAPDRWLPILGRATLAESVNSFRGVELCCRVAHRIDPAGSPLTVRYGLNPVRGDQSERSQPVLKKFPEVFQSNLQERRRWNKHEAGAANPAAPRVAIR